MKPIIMHLFGARVGVDLRLSGFQRRYCRLKQQSDVKLTKRTHFSGMTVDRNGRFPLH
jgi:hypothetical protein